MDIQNKIVLVTGGRGGIGSTVADAFSKEGAKVLIHSSKSSSVYPTFSADFKHAQAIAKMFENIKNEYGRIDMLINTVGIEEAEEDQLDTLKWGNIFAINLFGVVETSRHAIKLFGEEGGFIANISSIMGNRGVVGENSLAYSVAKAGLQKFSENIALMYAPKVRVVSIAPGYTLTPMWNSFPEEDKEKCKDAMTIKRFIQPQEVAEFIVSLAKNGAITGGNYTIDGGLHLKSII